MSAPTDIQLTREIIAKLSSYRPAPRSTTTGEIVSVTDGVVKASGLGDVAYLEMVEFGNGQQGVAINLEEKEVGIITLEDFTQLRQGDPITATREILSIPVGEAFIGRVVNPLGRPLDSLGSITAKAAYPLEKIAPSVTARQPVTVSLATGIKAIDALTPIGRGQRELIIGDRGIGKTSLALDAIINQKGNGVICIYVAVGQKTSRVAQVISALEKADALKHTIVVAANASDPASLQYLAPYAGCALGEYFMDQGKDVLIVYDDLSKHAWAYRQISLILKRPSGREAYPGDIFYLHSRLLERACRLDDSKGGGSLTALPIIETQAGDISAYIPTNVISITDGQIFLEPDLFYAGIRPAVSVGLSVSRVGGTAQKPVMKQVAGKLRLDLAQYRELAAFAQFSSDLDAGTRAQIDRGQQMTELLKQPQGEPLSMEDQVAALWAGTNNYLADIPVAGITDFETNFRRYLHQHGKKVLAEIASGGKLTPQTESELKQLITKFKSENA